MSHEASPQGSSESITSGPPVGKVHLSQPAGKPSLPIAEQIPAVYEFEQGVQDVMAALTIEWAYNDHEAETPGTMNAAGESTVAQADEASVPQKAWYAEMLAGKTAPTEGSPQLPEKVLRREMFEGRSRRGDEVKEPHADRVKLRKKQREQQHADGRLARKRRQRQQALGRTVRQVVPPLPHAPHPELSSAQLINESRYDAPITASAPSGERYALPTAEVPGWQQVYAVHEADTAVAVHNAMVKMFVEHAIDEPAGAELREQRRELRWQREVDAFLASEDANAAPEADAIQANEGGDSTPEAASSSRPWYALLHPAIVEYETDKSRDASRVAHRREKRVHPGDDEALAIAA